LWEGTHHDRRRKNCPAAEIPPLDFWYDVRAQRELVNGQVVENLSRHALEGDTDIVSTGMLVQRPDASKVFPPPTISDIFGPDVDFISRFAYSGGGEGDPMVGPSYSFTLLDANGEPIPGTTRLDEWTACLQDAPANVSAELQEQPRGIIVNWDQVGETDGFQPSQGVGFYQVTIEAVNASGLFLYGANLIGSNNHFIPYEDFNPGAGGFPDGYDFGDSLGELPGKREYRIKVWSFSEPPSSSQGVNLECEVTEATEAEIFTKESDGSITFR